MTPRALISAALATTLLAGGALVGAGCGSSDAPSTSADGQAALSAAVANKLSTACEKTAAAALSLAKAGDQPSTAVLTAANTAVDNIAVSLATVTVPAPAKQAWGAVVRHLGASSDALDDGIAAVVKSRGGQAAAAALGTATSEMEKAVSSLQLLAAETGFSCPVK